VEIVKEFTRLFEQGDRDVRRKYFDPDLVWDTSASNMPSADVLHGHEGVERSSATGLEPGGLRNCNPRVPGCRGRRSCATACEPREQALDAAGRSE
jgi:hypothetical protein